MRTVDPASAQSAAEMIAAAGLDWWVEQHALEAVVGREYQALRLPVPRYVATVRGVGYRAASAGPGGERR